MFSAFSRVYSIIISVVFLVFFLANAVFLGSFLLGALLLFFWLSYYGIHVGSRAAPQESLLIRFWIGGWLLLSGIMLVGSAIYYLGTITPSVIHALILLSVPISLWLGTKHAHKPPHDNPESPHRIPAAVFGAATIILTALALVVSAILHERTTEAIRSVWTTLPPSSFLAFFLASLLVIALLYRGRERALTIPLLCLTVGTMLSVAALLFPIGFGFDSFIHKATEAHIAEHGTISPKPLYYIGQYALVLAVHHGFAFPVDLIDTLLVPFLAALLLPLAFYSAAGHLLEEKRAAVFSLTALFLLPLSSFIVTTPQGLANLWTLLTICAAIPYLLRIEKPYLFPLLIAAAATLVTHPIAGIPVILFVALLATDPGHTNRRLQLPATILFWLMIICGSVLLPASFIVNSLMAGTGLGVDLTTLTPSAVLSSLHVNLFFENRFNPVLDFVYLYGFNAIAIVIFLSGIGWWIHRKTLNGRLRVLCALFLILVVNFILLSTAVDFSFLIDYERLNYANRLIPLMTFFLSPFLLLFFGSLRNKLKQTPVILQASTLVLLAIVTTSALYLTYPRHDSYVTGHGFNVSQNDISAVYAIDEDAGDSRYAVLANQSVSAAAIRSLGFKTYYGPIFFYPIPTGGELYQEFLNMNEAPSRETMNDARALIMESCGWYDCESPSRLYYVVNDYWWQAPRLIETGKTIADHWFAVGDGALHVFVFTFDSPPDLGTEE